MTDQKAYLDPLQDWFLAENIALDRQVNQLRGEVRRLKRQLSIASGQVSARNQLIHRMQLRTNFMERQFAEQLRLQQIYVDVEGTLLMYRQLMQIQIYFENLAVLLKIIGCLRELRI